MSAMADDYVIVTPAYNEERFIARTIESVVAQTVPPREWVIVDDASTDRMPDIVREYAAQHPWIKYVRRERDDSQTYYSSNVYALREGIAAVIATDYRFLAILDADIVLSPNYYEEILQRFHRYPELGIAAGTYMEKEGDQWVPARIDRRHTPKAIQVFRRECYEKGGGYYPFEYGGEDTGMEIIARLNGWQTWSFPELQVEHLRPAGTGDGRSILKARFRLGLADYSVSTHPLFMIVKCVKRGFWEKPFILSGLARLSGYVCGYFKRVERPLPSEASTYVRREQLRRLLRLFKIGKPAWSPRQEMNVRQAS